MKKEISKDLTLALKIIATVLRHTDSNSYAAYMLRCIRYQLLRNNGVRATRTYPHTDKLIAPNGFQFVKPFNIRYHARMNSGGCSTATKLLPGVLA